MKRAESPTQMASVISLLAGLILLVMPSPAAAYIDPISGSIVLQVIAAAVLAGLLSVKRAWGWVGSQFRELFGRRTGD